MTPVPNQLNRLTILVVLVIAMAACAAPTLVPSATPSSTPQLFSTSSPVPGPSQSPVVACLDLAGDCATATAAVLAAITDGNGGVVRIDLGRGVWCPTPGLLFANATCPEGGMAPAEGGRWIGHALVTFAGSPAQAYINIAKKGQTFRGAFIALATPPPATARPTSTG